MADIYKEYLIKQKQSPKDLLTQGLLIVGGVIVGGAGFFIGGSFFGPIIAVAVVFGVGFLFTMFNKEYEYILTNNELDIDVIYSRSRRKRVLTVDLKKIEIMANVMDINHKHELDKNYKVINASDNKEEKTTYAIMTQTDKIGTCKILMSPNETLLHEMYRQAPNKIFKLK